MKLGYHAPMPPSRTGVADYAAALARALEQGGARLAVNAQGDVDLYQVGNNGLHRDIYARALARPGATLIHDAVLHHFFLGHNDERLYVEEFVYNYGEWHRGLATQLWRDRARSGTDPVYFGYPMLRRIAEASRLVLVHNAAAARMVRAHCDKAPVMELPHLFEAPTYVPAGYEVQRLRLDLGIPAGGFLFGVFGHLRETKRLKVVLDAFARIHATRPHVRLLVAGDFVSDELQRALAEDLRQPGVIRTPYLDERSFWLHAHAIDACINLRFPTAGETSGIAIRMMGIGKPVLMTAGEETAAIPPDACIRVDAGRPELEMLIAYMLLLADAPETARRIGSRAGEHVRAHHGPERVAGTVLEAVTRLR